MEIIENWIFFKVEIDGFKLYLETYLVGKIVLFLLLVMGGF